MPYDSSGTWVDQSGASNTAPQNPYGYGTGPGQSANGYYEQQTPAGSFAAADYAGMGPQQYAQQQYANPYQMSNPYIGQQAAQISGPGSVMGYAQQGQYRNPYLGQQSQRSQGVGANPYGMGNPYLDQSIAATSRDATQNFQQSVMPGLDRAMQASGSFGNTGVQQMQQNAYSDLGRNLGNISNSARMQDYTQQQQLAENALNRGQQNNQFNAGLSGADLARNMSGGFQQAGMNNGLMMQGAMFDAANQMQGQQFNAGQRNNMGQFNAGLAQGQGQFNAGAQNASSQFNAGQGNQLGTFNASQGNALNQFGAGQRNSMNMFNTGQGNQMLSQYRNNTQQQGQFDATLDRNIYNDNMGWMRQGQQDQLGLYDRMFGWNQGGIQNAGNIQNAPMNYWQQFANGANAAGGLGGSNTNNQQFQGNPYLGAVGGWMTGGNLYNNWGG